MSKTKASGVSRLGRDSAAQRLGVKINSGEKAKRDCRETGQYYC